MPKLVLFDIDGTIVSHAANPSYIPEATLDALRKLADAGHVVAFNTARSFATASKLMRELNITNAVLCNGAHIILRGKTELLKTIDRDAAQRVLQLAKDGGCAIYAADEKYLYTHNVEESNLEYLSSQFGGKGYLRALGRMKRACKIDIYGDLPIDQDRTINACVIMLDGCNVVLPPETSKELGLAALAGLAGISLADTVAVGDGANDIGMLRAAGIGVAVGGAKQEVKDAADFIADKIEDGGIYMACRQLGLIG